MEDKAARKAERKAARKLARAAEAAAPSGAGDEAPPKRKKSTGVQKAFYVECAELACLSTTALEALRKSLAITLEDEATGSRYTPVRSFDEAGFPPAVRAACAGFSKPSPIQSQAWPIVLSGRDLVGIAATGSGKTLAFLLPALVHVAAQPRSGSGEPVVLVLAPTRELAMQTADVAATVGAECDVRSVCVYGGAPKGPQHAALRGGATIVVATPGRLEDLHEAGAVSYARVTFFVLDEADRMLDLGFEPAVRRIAAGVQPARQTVMFSATWPPSIRSLAAEFMVSPVMVRIGAEGTRASHSITQIVEVLDSDARVARLEQLLMQYQGGKDSSRRCLIFGLYKIEVTRIAATLRQRGWRCCEIQGDMLQKARTDAVALFKSAATPILVATDVAARGLDIPGVECVLNFSFPLTIEDYVHRIGRTGRAGATGVAHTFFCLQDKAHAGELVNVLREAGQTVPPELLKFGTHVKKKESKLYGAHFKDLDPTAKAKRTTFD